GATATPNRNFAAGTDADTFAAVAKRANKRATVFLTVARVFVLSLLKWYADYKIRTYDPSRVNRDSRILNGCVLIFFTVKIGPRLYRRKCRDAFRCIRKRLAV